VPDKKTRKKKEDCQPQGIAAVVGHNGRLARKGTKSPKKRGKSYGGRILQGEKKLERFQQENKKGRSRWGGKGWEGPSEKKKKLVLMRGESPVG